MTRLATALALVFAAGAAAAQPPSAERPQLVFAQVKGDAFEYEVLEAVPVTVEKTVQVERNGVPATEKVTVTEYVSVKKRVSHPLKTLRLSDGKGRPVAADGLKERLGTGGLVVLYTGPVAMPESYRRVYKDDTVLVELPYATGAGKK